MGLDNGVIVRGVKRRELSPFMYYPFEKDYGEGVTVCYWRKHWGLRQRFLRAAFPNTYDKDEYEYKLNVEKVNILFHIILDYLLHPSSWDNGYWKYKYIKHNLRRQAWNLFLLKKWMKRHPEAEVVFYDSY